MYVYNETIDGKPIERTGIYTHTIKVNKYDFAMSAPAKKLAGNAKKAADAERAIIDTIKYMGWISLKDSDHCEYGKGVGQGDARRAAADRLLAAGTVVLLGTWSNGIALGPGAGFVRATAQAAVVPAPTKKARKSRKPVFRMVDTEYEEARAQEDADDVLTGNSCAWTPSWATPGVSCAWAPEPMHGPAYVAPPAKPRVRYTWPKATPAVQEPVQTVSAAPTPIYQPIVGESVFIVLRHENGTTTDRVVDVQRVKLVDGAVTVFRGYDRRRDRCRNYQVADCLVMRAWDGQEVYDSNGRTVVERRNAA